MRKFLLLTLVATLFIVANSHPTRNNGNRAKGLKKNGVKQRDSFAAYAQRKQTENASHKMRSLMKRDVEIDGKGQQKNENKMEKRNKREILSKFALPNTFRSINELSNTFNEISSTNMHVRFARDASAKDNRDVQRGPRNEGGSHGEHGKSGKRGGHEHHGRSENKGVYGQHGNRDHHGNRGQDGKRGQHGNRDQYGNREQYEKREYVHQE